MCLCIKCIAGLKVKKRHFTGARFHTGGAEAELLVRIWFGLIRHRVIDGGSRAVILARATVVKVPTSLRARKRGANLTLNSGLNMLRCYKCERKHTPDSPSLWGRCSLQHTARDNSRSRRDLCSAYSLKYSARLSLKTHKHTWVKQHKCLRGYSVYQQRLSKKLEVHVESTDLCQGQSPG